MMTTAVIVFDDLPDLPLIEIFSYLSSSDCLWAFTRLNHRLTTLLIERGFFHHLNLSSARRRQFDSLLDVLPLNDIQSFIIDQSASPLQLIRWPYLPRLTRFTVKGVRHYEHVLIFVLLHAATLTHVKIESNLECFTFGLTKRSIYELENFTPFVEKILLRHLPVLRSLDLSFEINPSVRDWDVSSVQAPLTYLRLSLRDLDILLRLLATPPLSNTLQQLHVRMSTHRGYYWRFQVPSKHSLPRLISLHTFTYAQALLPQSNDVWNCIELLTDPTLMPMLKRVKLALAINAEDLTRIHRSMLFTDTRDIDVHYAFILNDDRQHNSELIKSIPFGSRSHPRQIASATFFTNPFDGRPSLEPNGCYSDEVRAQQHLWYTLPWAFSEFFQLPVPDRRITEMQVFEPFQSTPIISTSRLLKLNVSSDAMPTALTLPQIFVPDRIEELYMFYHDRNVQLKLPALRLLSLTNSLDVLNSCCLISTNIRSITIVLRQQNDHLARGNWMALRSVSALPLLTSLRMILYDILMCANDSSWQVIAEAAVMVVDFGFCFRFHDHGSRSNREWGSIIYNRFVQQLHRHILFLSSRQRPDILTERDGWGLIA